MRVHPGVVGLVLGLTLAFIHAGWAALVAAGTAQSVVDFLSWLHFFQEPSKIGAFDLNRAGLLVGLTFLTGLALGLFGAAVWNVMHPARQQAHEKLS